MGSIRRGVAFSALCMVFLGLTSPAWAQAQVERVYTGVAPPVVRQVGAGSGVFRASSVSAQPLPLQVSSGAVGATFAATAQAREEGLAFTGADVASLVLMGLGAITVGMVLTRRARPHSVPEA